MHSMYLPLLPCVVPLVPCVVPLVLCVLPLVTCVVPLVPCVVHMHVPICVRRRMPYRTEHAPVFASLRYGRFNLSLR